MPKKIQLTEQVYAELKTQEQEVKTSIPASSDPEVTVFDYEPMKKYLIYVPKNAKIIKYFNHPVGKTSYRCIKEIKHPELGLDGTCPLCDSVSESWDHYNMKLNAELKSRGIDPMVTAKESYKDVTTKFNREREIQEAREYTTFPMVLIEIETVANKIEIKLENNAPVFSAQVFNCSRYTYEEKWKKQLSNMGYETPNGLFFLVSYVYTLKQGAKADKRDAGREVGVTPRIDLLTSLKDYIDTFESTCEYLTPFKIENALTPMAIYPTQDLKGVANNALEYYRQVRMLSTAVSAQVNSSANNVRVSSPEEALETFVVPPK